MGLSLKVPQKIFSSVRENDLGYSIAKLLEPLVSKKLEEYRSLKEEREKTQMEIIMLEAQIRSTRARIESLTHEAPSLEGRFMTFMLSGLFLFILFILSLVAGYSILAFFLFVTSLIAVGAGLSAKSRAREMIAEAQRLNSHVLTLKNMVSDKLAKLRGIEARISSFVIPGVKIRFSRAFVPLALVKNPYGEGHILFTPWSEPIKIRVLFVSNPGAVEEAREKLLLGENIYLEAVVRGKDSGYKLIEGFKRLNLWERIIENRSPESILAEVVNESLQVLKGGISQEEEGFRIELLDSESVSLLLKLYTMSDGYVSGEVFSHMVDKVVSETKRFDYVVGAVEQLSSLGSYVEEAKQFSSKKEVYESIVNIAVREMIAKTMPLEEEMIKFGLVNFYCKRCASTLYDVYLPRLDLKRFVYDNILGGIDKDTDIVSPDPLVEEVVRKGWEDIEKSVNASLPLPGVTGDESKKEFEEKYLRALKIYSLPLTGADEHIEFTWSSVFQPPSVRCRRCGRVLSEEDRESLWMLQLPAIKGYIAVLSEKTRDLLEKSSEIITSVNNARLHKDQRKTAVGIYRQIFEEYQRELLHLEREISEAESQLNGVKKVMGVILMSEATQDLLQSVAAKDPVLVKQIRDIISTTDMR